MSISTTPRTWPVPGSMTAFTMETTSSALYSWLLRRFLPIGRGSSCTVPWLSTAFRYQLSAVSGSRLIGLDLVAEGSIVGADHQDARDLGMRIRYGAQELPRRRLRPSEKGRAASREVHEGLDVGVGADDGDDALHLAHVELDVAGDLPDELRGVAGCLGLDGAGGDERPEHAEGEEREQDHRDEGEEEFRPNASESQARPPARLLLYRLTASVNRRGRVSSSRFRSWPRRSWRS